MKLMKSLLLASVLMGMGTGCATTKQVVPLPNQATTTADPGKARIYVLRHTGQGAGAYPATVLDGTEKIGSTGPKGYLCWERGPGDALIRVVWPSTITPTLSVRCEPGRTYYVAHNFKMGVWTSIRGSSLELMSQEEGQKLLAKCKRPKVQ